MNPSQRTGEERLIVTRVVLSTVYVATANPSCPVFGARCPPNWPLVRPPVWPPGHRGRDGVDQQIPLAFSGLASNDSIQIIAKHKTTLATDLESLLTVILAR